MMTHKDYVKLAAAIASARELSAQATPGVAITIAAGEIANVLAADNPRFAYDRWFAAANGAPLTGRDRPRS